MKTKIIISLILILILISMGLIINLMEVGMEEEKPKYQGPVPEGYDEEHFRETGETILKKEINP